MLTIVLLAFAAASYCKQKQKQKKKRKGGYSGLSFPFPLLSWKPNREKARKFNLIFKKKIKPRKKKKEEMKRNTHLLWRLGRVPKRA